MKIDNKTKKKHFHFFSNTSPLNSLSFSPPSLQWILIRQSLRPPAFASSPLTLLENDIGNGRLTDKKQNRDIPQRIPKKNGVLFCRPRRLLVAENPTPMETGFL